MSGSGPRPRQMSGGGGRWRAVAAELGREAVARQPAEAPRLAWYPMVWYDRPMAGDFREVDPAELRLPASRFSGADPFKLQQQIARFGSSVVGMPPPWVYEGSDGVLEIINGATRATRIAKLAPGTLIRVEVIGTLRRPRFDYPRVGDRL